MTTKAQDQELAPYAIAFGKVASTEAGRFILAGAYSARWAFNATCKDYARLGGGRPTRRSEGINHSHGRALGEHAGDFDVEGIADAIIDTDERGRFFCKADPVEFWEVAQRFDTTA